MQGKTELDEELKMDLADRGQPEALANLIITRRPAEMGPPVDVEKIARLLGVAEISRIDTQGFEGTLVTDPEKNSGAIALKLSSPLERQRFTIAHEIGHFVIPTHGREAQCSLSAMRMPGKIGNKEAEANLFAATLLMPASMIRQDMRKWREPDLPKIVDLAGRYVVSKEAMARRVMDLTDNACAVVFSHSGTVSYPYRSKSFPYVDVAHGAPLPKYSVTARQPYSPGSFTDWTEVRLDVWLKGDLRRRGELFEQCLDLAGGHRMTLLSFDEE